MADSIISYEDLIGQDDTFDVIFQNIDQLKKELVELAQMQKSQLGLINPNDEEAVRNATKEVQNLTNAMKKLETEEKKAQKTKKKSNDLTNEELIAREKQKIANRERIQVAKQMAILQSKESGEIEKLRAKLSLTTLQWKKLTKEELNNTKKGKNLIKTKKDLTNQLKKLEKQTGDNRRNVGNYTAALGKMGKMAAGIFIGRGLAQGIRKMGAALGKLVEKNKDSSASAKSLSESFEKVGTILEKLGLFVIEVIAGPLQALISGFQTFASAVLGIDLSAKKASEGVRELQIEFNAEIETLKRGNLSNEARKQLIDDINKKYKDYLPNLLTEKSTLDEITAAQNSANAAMEKKILLLASEEMMVDITKKRLELTREQIGLEQTANKTTAEATKQNDRLAAAMEGADVRMQEAGITAQRNAADANNSAQTALRLNKEKLAQLDEEKKSIKDILAAQGLSSKDFLGLEKKKTEAAKKTRKAAAKVYKDNEAQRIAAVESLQAKIEKLEASNEEDKTERLLALEDVRFQALQRQRKKDFEKFKQLLIDQEANELAFYGEGSAELIAFQKFAGEELLRVEAITQKLSEEQLQASENKKLQIIKTANDKREAAATKTVKKAQNIVKKQTAKDEKLILDSIKQIDGEQEKADKNKEERLKKKADMEKQLMEGIQQTAEKVGAAIVDTFNKQAEGAASLVEQQSAAVETQRERAEQGLSNTLKFEQEQLAQREAERIRAEKKAKQAAELVALFNLVSAYAASGDSNALARGLVDWSLLKALSEGFEEGGYTGSGSSNSDVAGLVHKNEYVVTADDVKRYGLTGRAGGDFGEAMSDYFYSPLQRNMYLDQKGRFNDGLNSPANTFSRLENEVRAMRRAFEDMPKNDFDIMQMTDYFVEISKRVTSNRMTNISKQRKRL